LEKGRIVSCPKRAIDINRLGRIDVVVFSHRHPDPFDLPFAFTGWIQYPLRVERTRGSGFPFPTS